MAIERLPMTDPSPAIRAVAPQFAACLAFVLREEGGFSQDARDSGGATNYGITIGDLTRWRRRPCSPADVRGMEQKEAVSLYAAWYWTPLSCAMLPAGLDLIVFNAGVNMGIPTAAIQVQRRVGADQDGHLGPMTAVAARGAPREALMRGLLDDQATRYRSLSTFDVFGHGWMSRLNRCAALAWSMAGLASVPPVLSVAPTIRPVPVVSVAQSTGETTDALNDDELRTLTGA